MQIACMRIVSIVLVGLCARVRCIDRPDVGAARRWYDKGSLLRQQWEQIEKYLEMTFPDELNDEHLFCRKFSLKNPIIGNVSLPMPDVCEGDVYSHARVDACAVRDSNDQTTPRILREEDDGDGTEEEIKLDFEAISRSAMVDGVDGPKQCPLVAKEEYASTPGTGSAKRRTAVQVLCVIATHQGNHHRARAVAGTWGAECDGFVAFSNVTDDSIPVVQPSYPGEETYWNLWQKKVYMYHDIWEHFADDFDFFLFGEDDSFVLMSQLRVFLEGLRAEAKPGVYAGRRMRIGFNQDDPGYGLWYNAGGGYILDREALRRLLEVFATEAATGAHACMDGISRTSNGTADVLLSRCLRAANPPIEPYDTRDCMGRERFHHLNPNMIANYDSEHGIAGVAPSTLLFHLVKDPDCTFQMYFYMLKCSGAQNLVRLLWEDFASS